MLPFYLNQHHLFSSQHRIRGQNATPIHYILSVKSIMLYICKKGNGFIVFGCIKGKAQFTFFLIQNKAMCDLYRIGKCVNAI